MGVGGVHFSNFSILLPLSLSSFHPKRTLILPRRGPIPALTHARIRRELRLCSVIFFKGWAPRDPPPLFVVASLFSFFFFFFHLQTRILCRATHDVERWKFASSSSFQISFRSIKTISRNFMRISWSIVK